MSNAASLGDVRIIGGQATIPIQLPALPRMQRRLTRPMGRLFLETPIITRTYGGHSLWAGTPLAKTSVGDERVFELDDIFSNWDNVGFNWNFKDNRLEAYLTKLGQTYRVHVPAKKLKEILEATSRSLGFKKSCLCNTKPNLKAILRDSEKWVKDAEALHRSELGAPFNQAHFNAWKEANRERLKRITNKRAAYDAEMLLGRAKTGEATRAGVEAAQKLKTTYDANKAQLKAQVEWRRKCSGGFNLECFVSDVGKELDKAATNLGNGIGSFFKDPGKWIQDAARDVGKFIDEVGMVALDVVSSPIFAGIAGVLSFIPPLNAIGGAALAASAAANAVKPALSVVGSVAKVVGGDLSAVGGVPGVGPIVKSIVPALPPGVANVQKTVDKAAAVVNGFKAGTVKLPKNPQGLVVAALQSTPAVAPVKVAAQRAPSGQVHASVYPPNQGQTRTLEESLSAMPEPALVLLKKALLALPKAEIELFISSLKEPMKGRSAWEVIYRDGVSTPRYLLRKGVQLALKGTAPQQFAFYLRQAR